ncbi:MAG TPA: recombinase family protein, partial [Planctomycetaceae bacterium]|nr:recombinase family protein [Planctomycetaceae bacterium]
MKTKFFARPIACELSRRMEAGDSLIVTKLDRLGRNVADCFRALSSLSAGGIAIYVLEFQDSKVPILSGSSGKSLLGVLKSCAGLERSSRSERVRECKAERRMVGLNPGGFLPFVLRREIQNGREVLVSN